MPHRSQSVGRRTTLAVTCDARWLMAYSAAVGATEATYFDTRHPIIAHPVFPVAVEWALLTHIRDPFGFGLTRDETARGVHASQRMCIHRLVQAGDELVLDAEVVGMQPLNSGTLSTVRFVARTTAGEPVWTSWMGTISRGVDLIGPAVAPDCPPLPHLEHPSATVTCERSVDAGAAHVYTECARIWNPIHTDAAVAAAAGLPGIILHGTATLAYTVTALMHTDGIAPDAVTDIGCSFRAMVPLPSELHISSRTGDDPQSHVGSGHGVCAFTTSVEGRPAVHDGVLAYGVAGPTT